MFNKILIACLVIISSNINLGDTLKCNLCIGSWDSECKDGVNSSMVSEECRFLMDKTDNLHADLNDREYDFHCTHEVYSEDNAFSKYVIRDCLKTIKGFDNCQVLGELMPNLVSCSVCDSDYCN